MISKIEVERFTLSSSKPFDQVVAALDSAVGHPDISEFWKSTHRAQSVAELQSTIVRPRFSELEQTSVNETTNKKEII